MIPLHIKVWEAQSKVTPLCRLHFNGCWGDGGKLSPELQSGGEQRYVCVLQGQKEGFRQQVLAVSNTGDQQQSGPLPKAADTELGPEARTFSQFISLKLRALPNGQVPTSIIWS